MIKRLFLITLLGTFLVQGSQAAVIIPPPPPEESEVQQRADAYLVSLRATPGALTSLLTLSGISLPASGSLTAPQNQQLIDQLFKEDGSHSLAYDFPDKAAQALPPGANYLQALRQNPDGISSLQSLTNRLIPTIGPLSGSDIDFLYTQLYDKNNAETVAFQRPAESVQALVQGVKYLNALRQTPGALSAMQSLIGKTLPTNGTLNEAELETLFNQLFKADGSQSEAYKNPTTETAVALVKGSQYLDALRGTPGALAAMQSLIGKTLPTNGTLDDVQLETLFNQLFKADGSQSEAYKNPTPTTALALVKASQYLQALRDTPGALNAMQSLTGKTLPTNGTLNDVQLETLFNQLFKADGSQSEAYKNPTTETALALVKGSQYLQALRDTPGALAAMQSLIGKTLPTTGTLNDAQLETLFNQLFKADGSQSEAYKNPTPTTALALVKASQYLQALRDTPGALNAMQSLIGKTLPTNGTLNDAQLETLFNQLFKADGSQSEAYKNPTTETALALVKGSQYLQALRDTPGALAAMQSLIGKTLPTSGTLNDAQLETLFNQLFKADGSQSAAYKNPTTETALALVKGSQYLQALRDTPGALAAMQSLIGKTLPTTGTLNDVQLETLFNQLFKADGSQSAAYKNPTTETALALVKGSQYLQALRDTPGALAAMQSLIGKTLPTSGTLNDAQLETLFNQLFKADGSQSAAYKNPTTETALALVKGSQYLQALRDTPGALAAMQSLIGKTLPTTGTLNDAQLETLFNQLFKADGSQSAAYKNPTTETALALVKGSQYLQALRDTPGALAAMQSLIGKTLPTSGTLNDVQLETLFNQLFKADGSQSAAYKNPTTETALALVKGSQYLQALRDTPGALAAMQSLIGKTLPTSGTLNDAQLETLFNQLFKADGSQSAAYKNPTTETALALVKGSQYLQALRDTPGALDAMQSLIGKTLPTSGTLNDAQLETLFNQLFKADGSQSAAYKNPTTETALALVKGSQYLQALRDTPGALAAMQSLIGKTLPTSGTLNDVQLETLFNQLFKADGSQSAAYKNPTTETALALVKGSQYLQALRDTPGALAAMQSLIGKTLPTSGTLNDAQLETLFNQLFKADGSQSEAYKNPTPATALALVKGSQYLQALRDTPGALDAMQSLIGKTLPTSGTLNDAQLETLFNQLFKADGSQSAAYKNPTTETALALVKGSQYLQALRDTPGALDAMQSLIGKTLPTTGTLNDAQLETLFNQLFKADGSQSAAYKNPTTETALALVKGSQYLQALRDTAGALEAMFTLIGKTLPTMGILNDAQLETLFNQLFKSDGSQSAAYKNPTTETALALVKGSQYLQALRDTPGALAAMQSLIGKTLPTSGTLNDAQLETLFNQLFKSDGSQSEAYKNPTTATALALVKGAQYLQALRDTPGALEAMFTLIGKTLPTTGTLNDAQLETLFNQLFKSDGSQSEAYINPTTATALALVKASQYLQALRNTSGALAALEGLTGQKLPTIGSLSEDQIDYLFKQLFDKDANPTDAFRNPTQAVDSLMRAYAFLQALRAEKGAMDALEQLTGTRLPDSGPLTVPQIEFLFTQLFDEDGKPTEAYSDPTGVARTLGQAIKKSRFGLFLIAGILAGALSTTLLNKTGILSSRTATFAGIAVAGTIASLGYMVGRYQGTSSSNGTSTPAVVVPAVNQVAAGSSQVGSSQAGSSQAGSSQTGSFRAGVSISEGTSVSALTSIDTKSVIVGPERPDQAYLPLYRIDGKTGKKIQNAEGVAATYAQGRWAATAASGHESLADTRAALDYAGSANKKVHIAGSKHSQ